MDNIDVVAEAPRFLGNLASLFSPPTVRRLAEPGGAALVFRTLRQSGIDPDVESLRSLSEAFEFAYEVLLRHRRSEYVYKNAIASKILLGRHSLRTAALLQELPIYDAKADLVLLNGTSVAYEIKTELDSLDRLQQQLASYTRAIDQVFVATHESLVDRLSRVIPANVGLLALTHSYSLQKVRDAASNLDNLEHSGLFNLLRRQEYTAIIRRQFGVTPKVPNTLIYRTCLKHFEDLPIERAHDEVVMTLKARAQALVSGDAVAKSPHSLCLHALTGNLTPSHIDILC